MIEHRIIDEIDLTILRLLEGNARLPNAEIARRVGMAPSAVLERIRKLEEAGMIRGYHADLDPRRLGRGLLAFVFVRGDEIRESARLGSALGAIPGVQEVHHVAGEDCYLLKVRVEDTAALGKLLQQGIGALPDVSSTRTTIVLNTLKETGQLELESHGGGADE
jgi:Lrp/AsnC family leucine-responsive transcriptional regulator